jgi:hypothetical protein
MNREPEDLPNIYMDTPHISSMVKKVRVKLYLLNPRPSYMKDGDFCFRKGENSND